MNEKKSGKILDKTRLYLLLLAVVLSAAHSFYLYLDLFTSIYIYLQTVLFLLIYLLVFEMITTSSLSPQ